MSAGVLRFEIADLGRNAEGELWLWMLQEPHHAEVNGTPIPLLPKGAGVFAIQLAVRGVAQVRVK